MAPERLSNESLYQLLREQVKYESETVNQRINWLLATHAFFIAGFTATYTNVQIGWVKYYLLALICGVGTFLCYILLLDIRRSASSVCELAKYWRDQAGEDSRAFPPLFYRSDSAAAGEREARNVFSPSRTIPVMFGISWFILLMFTIGTALAFPDGLPLKSASVEAPRGWIVGRTRFRYLPTPEAEAVSPGRVGESLRALRMAAIKKAKASTPAMASTGSPNTPAAFQRAWMEAALK
jgi:hypothetical protein